MVNTVNNKSNGSNRTNKDSPCHQVNVFLQYLCDHTKESKGFVR